MAKSQKDKPVQIEEVAQIEKLVEDPRDLQPITIPDSMEFPRVGLREYRADGPLKIQLLAGPKEVALVESPAVIQLNLMGHGRSDIYLLYPASGRDDPKIAPSTFDGLWLSLSRMTEAGTRVGRAYGPMKCGSWARFTFREEPEKRYIRYLCRVESAELDVNNMTTGSIKDLSKIVGVPTSTQLQQHPTLKSRSELPQKIIPW